MNEQSLKGKKSPGFTLPSYRSEFYIRKCTYMLKFTLHFEIIKILKYKFVSASINIFIKSLYKKFFSISFCETHF